MKILLKYILISLFCVSTIKNACTGTAVTESVCEQDTTCKWTQTVQGSCSGDTGCSSQTSETACQDANVVCTFESNTCSGGASCTGVDSAACEANNVACTWNAATGTCTDKTCADYSDQTDCNAVTTCEWASGSCTTKSSTTTSCDSYKTESTCNDVATCQWSNNACSTKSSTTTCASYTTENDCKAVTTCEWSNNACSAKSTTTTTTPEGNGVFGLKSSILLFLISFLF